MLCGGCGRGALGGGADVRSRRYAGCSTPKGIGWGMEFTCGHEEEGKSGLGVAGWASGAMRAWGAGRVTARGPRGHNDWRPLSGGDPFSDPHAIRADRVFSAALQGSRLGCPTPPPIKPRLSQRPGSLLPGFSPQLTHDPQRPDVENLPPPLYALIPCPGQPSRIKQLSQP